MVSEYDVALIEELLRNYYSLSDMGESDMFVDLSKALSTLWAENNNLYNTIMAVLVFGKPIQSVALDQSISTRQVNRRLHDALYALAIIMNGESFES